MSENDQNSSFEYTPWLDPEATPLVQLRGISKHFGDVVAVDQLDLDIYSGELFAILGGSGSGKSTLLRILAGFERPTAGSVLIDGSDVTAVAPYDRPVNMMFQSYALFPHMTVERNVAYGLKKEGVPRDEIRHRVNESLKMVELEKLAGRKPDRLSGGERQRVALARALVKKPKLLLLDEPLAALDKKLREQTQFELMNLQEELGITFIVVTHDQEEAMTLASRMAVMNRGQLEQIGTPSEVYEYPDNRFVADFIGKINLLDATVVESQTGQCRFQSPQISGELMADCSDLLNAGDQRWLAIRPEKIFIGKDSPDRENRTVQKGTVLELGYLGNLSVYRVRLESGAILQASGQNRVRSTEHRVEWDDEVFVSWDNSSIIVLHQ